MDMNQYLDIFLEEAKEHLQSMNQSLLNLEKDFSDKELLNEIFRVSHTLKGMAGTMGYSKMSSLTHEMENLLHAVRGGKIDVTEDIIDVLFECFDLLEEYTAYIAENGEEGNSQSKELVAKLNHIINNEGEVPTGEVVVKEESKKTKKDSGDLVLSPYVKTVIAKAKAEGMNSYTINIRLSENCVLKSARAFIIFKTLENHSEIVYAVPSVEDIEDEKFDSEISLTVVSKVNGEKINKEISLISEIEEVIVEEVNVEENAAEDIKLEKEEVKEAVIQKETKKEVKEKSKDTNASKKSKQNMIGKTVRVDIDRLDNLMNLVSELIIIKTQMEDSGNSENAKNMHEAIEYLERITTSLHDAVMKVRMVPIERVFNRFPRMVRDLSKDLGKNIKLEMMGEETEVDRTVIDEIGDPLIHLIRNSIDHGIETPEIRVKAGKSETGVVKLLSYPDGNNVVIEVVDDGAGINTDKVRGIAISKNLISEEKANQLTKNEVAELLFLPGFSTAEKVTDLSGRGVGLDVVKSKIEAIGGVVEVETNEGAGSRFIIRIPLSLAIIQALLIKVKEEMYAIPLSSIKEINPIRRDSIRRIQDQDVVLYRNKTLPIIDLRDVLNLHEERSDEFLMTVIVKKGEKEAGLIVDSLIGQQEIVIKSLGKFLSGVKHIAGATILGNGAISLILDTNSLF